MLQSCSKNCLTGSWMKVPATHFCVNITKERKSFSFWSWEKRREKTLNNENPWPYLHDKMCRPGPIKIEDAFAFPKKIESYAFKSAKVVSSFSSYIFRIKNGKQNWSSCNPLVNKAT
jgi:hypothetical protein